MLTKRLLLTNREWLA